MIGGTGRDLFVYVSAAEGGDTIKDFVVTDDTLVFSASGFGGGLTAGQQLVAGVTFIADASPIATTDFGTFLYNTTTHDLTWDVDGSGATGAVQIAHFNTAVSLSADHFNIRRKRLPQVGTHNDGTRIAYQNAKQLICFSILVNTQRQPTCDKLLSNER